MVSRLREGVRAGARTSLKELLSRDRADPGTLRSGALRKAYRGGDTLVRRVVREAAEYTGYAVANLINMMSPEVVVLGGGVIEALKAEMMPVVIEKARAHALLRQHEPAILATKLGDYAGITGAAVLASRRQKRRRATD
jgi:glucokinase